MATHPLRSRLIARIWQSIAQSDVQMTSLPQDQLNALVEAIADGVVEVVVGMTAESGLAGDPAAETAEELELWSGRPFLSLVERYSVTTERVRVLIGLLKRHNENVELVRVIDINYRQNLLERLLGIGDIHLHSSDPSQPDLRLRNVRHPERVHDLIRRAVLSARRRYRFSFQDEM